MIPIYSIAAVFFMIVAIGAMYQNFTSRSPFYLDIFGKKYARESKAVTGIFERLEWGAGGGYWMICRIEECEIEIKFPHTRTVSGDSTGKEIQLILLKDADSDVYMLQNHRNEKPFVDCVVMEPEEIAQQNKKVQAIFVTAVAGCCVGFACLQAIPVFSCILFLASTAAFVLSRPLLDWKKCEDCCKIYTKKAEKAKTPKVDLKRGAFPPDFDHWSQIQKDLYGITVRLESERMAGRKDAELGDDDPPVEESVNIEQPNIVHSGHSKEPGVYDGIIPKACKNCGCIVDNDAYYCPNCGAPQEKVPDFPKNWERLEEFEKKLEDKPEDTFSQEAKCEKTAITKPLDNTVPKEQEEKPQKPNASRRGKKSKNRRYRPAINSSGTDVDKMIQSLEAPSQLTL